MKSSNIVQFVVKNSLPKSNLNVTRSRPNTTAIIKDSENSSDEEDDIDLFSLEVVDDGIVCVCNLCNTGLENESELTNHLKEKHEKTLNVAKKYSKWTDCKSRDCGTCMECAINKYQ